MIIFWRLILAHIIADFTLQTNHVANWKRESKLGMAVHIVTHPLISLVLVWPYLSMTWLQTPWFSLSGWVCVLLVTFLHWLEDEWRIWSIQKTGSPDSTAFFLWDQVVHIAVILALVPALPTEATEHWVSLAICATLLGHFTSVLIYYLENDLWGQSSVLRDRKYQLMGERFLGASLFLLPGAWFLLALGWVGWVGYQQYHNTSQRTWVHQVVGNCAVVILGLIARGILLA